MRRFLVVYVSFALVGSAEINRGAVVAEINYARQQPQVYAGLIEQWASYFRGQLLMLPGRTALMTHEGAPAVREAVRALRASKSMAALAEFAPLDQTADDFVREQGPRGGGDTWALMAASRGPACSVTPQVSPASARPMPTEPPTPDPW